MSDVDRPNLGGSALQKAIRESAGRRADVETRTPGDIQVKSIQRAGEFVTAAAHIRHALQDVDGSVACDTVAGLLHFLTRHQHLPGQHQRLRFFTRRSQTALDQELIEANLAGFLYLCSLDHGHHALRCTTRSASSRRRVPRSSKGFNARCAARR